MIRKSTRWYRDYHNLIKTIQKRKNKKTQKEQQLKESVNKKFKIKEILTPRRTELIGTKKLKVVKTLEAESMEERKIEFN